MQDARGLWPRAFAMMQLMQPLLLIFFFGLGTILASFVGVLAARLYTGQSMFGGRSRCDACGRELGPFALVPIASYVFSGGRARCCGARISSVAPLSELLLGILFAFSFQMLGLTLALLFFLVALAALLALVLYDFAHQILPTPFLIIFLSASLAYAVFSSSNTQTLFLSLITALGCGLLLALVHILSRGRAMGLADAPLVVGLALLSGPLALSGFVFSFWVGGAVGIVVLLGRPAGSRMGVEVPFAPFLAAGFLLAIFTGWNLLTLIGILP